ncbi:10888_t:CDS:2 [Gigaspora margarita]|uniref:10888_t:CDS:1 n=1 Tax=Gigaspora margarita TaxID=4874 RepID=A0ABM8W5F6_GIGMA|nr:10888_t:CDS:2 [Gigaspora margarita]
MEQCWDADPFRRPNIKELLDDLNKRYSEINESQQAEFADQCKNVDCTCKVIQSPSLDKRKLYSEFYSFSELPLLETTNCPEKLHQDLQIGNDIHQSILN